MKIHRTIERTIILTPSEVYAAIAAKYDLPTKPDSVWFDSDTTCSSSITLMAQEVVEQEYENDA